MDYYVKDFEDIFDSRPIPKGGTSAEDAAKHFRDEGDAGWPLTFVLIDENGERTFWLVSLIDNPSFSAVCIA